MFKLTQIKKMKIQTTKHHYSAIKLTKISNSDDTTVGEIWRNYALSDSADAAQIGVLFGRQFGNTYSNVHIPSEPAISLRNR